MALWTLHLLAAAHVGLSTHTNTNNNTERGHHEHVSGNPPSPNLFSPSRQRGMIPRLRNSGAAPSHCFIPKRGIVPRLVDVFSSHFQNTPKLRLAQGLHGASTSLGSRNARERCLVLLAAERR